MKEHKRRLQQIANRSTKNIKQDKEAYIRFQANKQKVLRFDATSKCLSLELL